MSRDDREYTNRVVTGAPGRLVSPDAAALRVCESMKRRKFADLFFKRVLVNSRWYSPLRRATGEPPEPQKTVETISSFHRVILRYRHASETCPRRHQTPPAGIPKCYRARRVRSGVHAGERVHARAVNGSRAPRWRTVFVRNRSERDGE